MFSLVYVDGMLITGRDSKEVQSPTDRLNKSFALKDLGNVDFFLGMQVKATQDGVPLSQTRYIHDLLCRAKMQCAKPIGTPMTTGFKLPSFGSDDVTDSQLYKSIVGALQYATITRPKLSYSVNKICQFM